MASNVSLRRLAYLGLAYGCVGLGAAGIVLPLLPTTPFLLVAAWAAPKGSPRVEAWLYDHPYFGPPLRAWHEQRAVPRRAKWIACLLLLSSWLVLWLSTDSPIVPVITGLLFMGVATFLVTRPDAAPETIRVSDDPG
ncbi:YbaN family protein [Modicisalibacter xianhensis]|uniref:Inner membrane protein n=1 Tax=Modicisalibacter xianhensis TaxID=442341 RepID=A0A1I3DKS2_9GAMM|nr:YbaN family protein [Halomonas xianhensis]SFH87179.1 hypothetical protein SAMN04487959_11191 [Halomonas xianhensis]